VNVLGMHACKRVHDKLWCTRLQNYTLGASLLDIQIPIPKSNIPLVYNRYSFVPEYFVLRIGLTTAHVLASQAEAIVDR